MSDILARLLAALVLIISSAVTPSGAQQPASLSNGTGAGMHAVIADEFPSRSSHREDTTTSVERAAVLRPVPHPSAKPVERSPATGTATKPVRPKPTPGLLPVARTGVSLRGTATWYCCTRGHGSGELVAAAGPGLRIGDWRGRRVTVSMGGRSLSVRLVDWCACPGHLIDLHPGAFKLLGALSRGVLTVTVTW